MNDLFAGQEPDRDLVMIFDHARRAGWLRLPRQEYADSAAEAESLRGYAIGAEERESASGHMEG